MTQSTFSIKSIYLIVATLAVSCCYMLPLLRLYLNVQTMAVLTAAFGIFVLYDNWKKTLASFRYILGYGLVMFLVAFPLDFKYGFLHPMMLLWITVFPSLLARYLAIRRNKLELFVIIAVNIILFVVIGKSTQSYMQEYPILMRTMTSGDTDEDFKSLMCLNNVGSFGYAYGCGVLFITTIGLLLYAINEKIAKWKTAVLLVVLGVSGYIVINAMFTTLLLLTILAFVVMFWNNIRSLEGKLFVSVLLIISIFYGKDVLGFLASFYPDSPVSIHLNDLKIGESESSLRTQYQLGCFANFLYSPLWGQSVSGSLNHLYNHSHSSLLSIAMSTGIIGTYCYYKSFCIYYLEIFKNLPNKIYKRLWLPLVVFFWALTLLNPTSSDEFSWLFLFVSPLLINYFTLEKNEKMEE